MFEEEKVGIIICQTLNEVLLSIAKMEGKICVKRKLHIRSKSNAKHALLLKLVRTCINYLLNDFLQGLPRGGGSAFAKRLIDGIDSGILLTVGAYCYAKPGVHTASTLNSLFFCRGKDKSVAIPRCRKLCTWYLVGTRYSAVLQVEVIFAC